MVAEKTLNKAIQPHTTIEKGYYIQLRKIQELPSVKTTFFAKFFRLACPAFPIDRVFPGKLRQKAPAGVVNYLRRNAAEYWAGKDGLRRSFCVKTKYSSRSA